MARYLVNENSDQSAGWYSDDVARVLLADGFNGWSEAEAPVEDTDLDLSLLNPFELRQHEAVQAGHVLTEVDLHPELAPPTPPPPVPALTAAGKPDPDPGAPPETPSDPPSADPTPGGTAELEGN